jgi:beta-glucuronidase
MVMQGLAALLPLLLAVVVTVEGWPNQPPFWPHYPIRSNNHALQVLDGMWDYGYNIYKGDVTSKTINTAEITLPLKVAVPNSFDYVAPGYDGPRGTALYRTQVNITAGRRAVINFSACSFYCNVYVDNMWVGDHRAGGYSPFWLSIPPSQSMTRTVFVVVDNRFNSTTAPVHTGGDFYHLGGIHRSVIVHQLPDDKAHGALYLQRLEITPKDYKEGLVNINVVLSSNYNGSVVFSVSWDGSSSSTSIKATATSGIAPLTNLKVPNPKPWAVGAPNLHTVTVGISDANEVYDDIEARFGLRVLGKANSRVTVNDFAVKLHGHNRHTIWPDVGPVLTLEQIHTDIELLQGMGSNYVRGAHYPQDQRFLDACDEAGIAVWEETLGPSVTAKNTENTYFMQYQLQQMNEMISASFNHPSVIFWGFFNEGASDDVNMCPGYQACAEVANKRDPSRFATWADNQLLNDKCLKYADVISFNSYPGWYSHGGDSAYPIEFWSSVISDAAKTYSQPITISETGCEGLYEWVNSSTTLWGQSYQNIVISNNIKTILGSARVTGMAIWVFADFKGNDDAQHVCGPCTYLPGTHNATNINIACNGSCGLGCRPCGENHKGSVDFWRRKKQVYEVVHGLYTQQWP